MIRKERAVWRGSDRAGNGDLSSDSGVLANTPYSFRALLTLMTPTLTMVGRNISPTGGRKSRTLMLT